MPIQQAIMIIRSQLISLITTPPVALLQLPLFECEKEAKCTEQKKKAL